MNVKDFAEKHGLPSEKVEKLKEYINARYELCVCIVPQTRKFHGAVYSKANTSKLIYMRPKGFDTIEGAMRDINAFAQGFNLKPEFVSENKLHPNVSALLRPLARECLAGTPLRIKSDCSRQYS